MRSNEQIGWIPRSIIRTCQRFFKQIGFQTDLFAIYEFRVSRYFAIASVQCFLWLILCPWLFQFLIKFVIVKWVAGSEGQAGLAGLAGLASSGWPDGPGALQRLARSAPWPEEPPSLPQYSIPIFLNFRQQEQALDFLENMDAQIYFDSLISVSPTPENSDWVYQTADFYSKQSLDIITNWIGDFTTLIFFLFVLFFSKPQIIIFKTFLVESLFSLSETTKCFFLIFFLDLLVGFHSSKSWEIFLQFIIEHFGLQINQNFLYFFISTFPVLLDTIFKYWIFRYLNKISPSTVATYQAMIE
uniref:Envelope membrane protein n=1 Tax=Caulerpa cliftonii TaxID=1004391 RepID=A0A1C9JBT0_9CHLO|nr:envelope membrane protein [Caulerpa cliftonii]AOP19306.1 envelope membrane protein [Caulerpa cliftonii]